MLYEVITIIEGVYQHADGGGDTHFHQQGEDPIIPQETSLPILIHRMTIASTKNKCKYLLALSDSVLYCRGSISYNFV